MEIKTQIQPGATAPEPDHGLGMYCTKAQALRLLGVGPATLDRYRKRPDFPKARILSEGHLVRFKTDELVQWIDAQIERR